MSDQFLSLVKLATTIYAGCLLVGCVGTILTPTTAAVTYNRFACPNTQNVTFPGVSGVREVYGVESNVYVTGVYVQYGSNHAFLYQGSVLGGGGCHEFNYPSASGRTVTMTSLYGPDNNGFGKVVVVGSYTTSEANPNQQFGLLYSGNPDGTTLNGYSTLLPQGDFLTNGEVVINTIGHSTMGGIVVGDFDTNLVAGRAFAYNITNNTYYELTAPNYTKSITAYGIWYNGGTSYTITGGYGVVHNSGVDVGFIADWDSTNPNTLTNFTTLNYNNLPESQLGTHFEGITGDGQGGYNLAGDWQYLGQQTFPTFAHVVRNSQGSLVIDYWYGFAYFPGSIWTSANTIYRNYILGLAETNNPLPDFGYVATIPVSN